jgi:hypothetical protein
MLIYGLKDIVSDTLIVAPVRSTADTIPILVQSADVTIFEFKERYRAMEALGFGVFSIDDTDNAALTAKDAFNLYMPSPTVSLVYALELFGVEPFITIVPEDISYRTKILGQSVIKLHVNILPKSQNSLSRIHHSSFI